MCSSWIHWVRPRRRPEVAQCPPEGGAAWETVGLEGLIGVGQLAAGQIGEEQVSLLTKRLKQRRLMNGMLMATRATNSNLPKKLGKPKQRSIKNGIMTVKRAVLAV